MPSLVNFSDSTVFSQLVLKLLPSKSVTIACVHVGIQPGQDKGFHVSHLSLPHVSGAATVAKVDSKTCIHRLDYAEFQPRILSNTICKTHWTVLRGEDDCGAGSRILDITSSRRRHSKINCMCLSSTTEVRLA